MPLLDKLFGGARAADEAEAALYGDFAIGPEVTIGALRDTYGLPIAAGDQTLTMRDLFRREFRSDLEIGDRVHLGDIDLIVRDIRDGQLLSVGLSLDPSAKPLQGWERFKAKLVTAIGAPGP